MLSIGGLILRGSIVLSTAMIALISLKPSAVISMNIGTAAGHAIKCGRMITGNNNASKLANRGRLFCSDNQARWLCEAHRCYANGRLALPMYFNDCQADKGTVPGLRVLAAQYQNIDGKNFAVQGWEVIGGKTVITPGLHYCKSSRAALSVCNGCTYFGPNDQ
ncbi:hypothetical protein MJO28_013722 [Puccinia striiformis f. sp. tritici]|uniref:Uncharacterized protein n=1 Tax=Puccinia striiformis f. sp. tritici TaxID=168172 RepID=A0ACC0DWD3_9BASI|nr:hypothetical protein MJO28_013722 [Puccinia striiformis f. sp. tritici]KAI7941483.1 hypothetical protein MJO29_013557 [Puccinia striiformis f. sp. tritici]